LAEKHHEIFPLKSVLFRVNFLVFLSFSMKNITIFRKEKGGKLPSDPPFLNKKTDINMNKRMKDPKGDLRFVHKLTRVYDFSSLKLTAMTYRRQAGKLGEIVPRHYLIPVFRHSSLSVPEIS